MELTPGTIHADLQVQFAGQSVDYKQVSFQVTAEGKNLRLTGTIPAKLSDFRIPPPSLLTIPIRNDIPVRVEMLRSPGT